MSPSPPVSSYDMGSPPQPASSAIFSALYFPADEDRPKVVRVNCTPASPAHSQRPQSPQHAMAIAATAARPCQWDADTKPWLGSQPTGSVVLTHGLNGEPLRFPLHLFYVPDSLAKGTPVNRSIYKLTNGLAPRKWSGNVSLSSRGTCVFAFLLIWPLPPRSSLSNTVAPDDRRTRIVRQTTCPHWFPTFYHSSKYPPYRSSKRRS
jgi:hypothetical protein